jgi:hypothetical protein
MRRCVCAVPELASEGLGELPVISSCSASWIHCWSSDDSTGRDGRVSEAGLLSEGRLDVAGSPLERKDSSKRKLWEV